MMSGLLSKSGLGEAVAFGEALRWRGGVVPPSRRQSFKKMFSTENKISNWLVPNIICNT